MVFMAYIFSISPVPLFDKSVIIMIRCFGKIGGDDMKLKLCVDIIILEDKNLNKVQLSILKKISKHQYSLH